jgi:hypothetical protein
MRFELLGRNFGYESRDRVLIPVKHLVLLTANVVIFDDLKITCTPSPLPPRRRRPKRRSLTPTRWRQDGDVPWST